MKKLIIVLLLLVSVGVVASNDQLRSIVISKFRSIVEPLFDNGEVTEPKFDTFYMQMVEDFDPQQKAEKSLELALNRFVGATDYILQNAQEWRGLIKPSPSLSTLINTALNAPLMEIRMAAFELYLAQYDLAKTEQQVDILINRYYENPIKTGPWALWSMAVIGARGVDRERIFNELMLALENDNLNVRRWAVDSMAKFGGQEIVEPLLQIAAYDKSILIQERAFCGLAQSGSLHVIERYDALEGLLVIIRDPESSQQTLSYAYQALKEITNFYDIPKDPDQWQDRLIEVDMIRL
jgi:hypothetical protein